MSKLVTITTLHEVPDDATYIAQDPCGWWLWYQDGPYPVTKLYIPDGSGDGWCNSGGGSGTIMRASPNPNWRDTLRKIDDPEWRMG